MQAKLFIPRKKNKMKVRKRDQTNVEIMTLMNGKGRGEENGKSHLSPRRKVGAGTVFGGNKYNI